MLLGTMVDEMLKATEVPRKRCLHRISQCRAFAVGGLFSTCCTQAACVSRFWRSPSTPLACIRNGFRSLGLRFDASLRVRYFCQISFANRVWHHAAQTRRATPRARAPLMDPRDKYPKPPFPEQHQPWPGLASKMQPVPDHGETSYRGSGRLQGRACPSIIFPMSKPTPTM
jgi:hypothetical protein